ncbi:biotin--[acetyl-CoA-carboxylase] ligase [Hanstruepera flava]|uniref:biotin--[acetyl-CoA-carboxylase] ligase n=1 Tax=Hanstruepera flava TaxID=2930218 RepID=UPI002029066C|nr:biotin--[acetyl-CoA-carboxylase] ligase [Hanstruepera flava]
MHIIKLNATDSTNSYLRQLSNDKSLSNYTVVTADKQNSGRGQMGTSWESETGKNLIASVFVDVSFLQFNRQFYISMATCLALIKMLKQFSIPKLKIKWPNDILSENKKICGVLIEYMVKQNNLQSTIIGVGLNVNQLQFDNLPHASSLGKITGVHYNLDELLLGFITHLKYYLNLLEQNKLFQIKEDYESSMFRKDKPSTFKDAQGNLFSGFIKAVTDSGKLQILIEDNELREYDLKEIQLLY